MKIVRAAHMGQCFGVRDAITLARGLAARKPVTILGQLAHNESVVDDLRRRGVGMADREDELDSGTVLITAHGASQKRIDRVKDRGFEVAEATCPLVRHAHDSVLRLARAGYFPVIVGKRGHVEVNGLTEDLAECEVVLTPEDIDRLPWRARYGVASQTTQPVARVEALADRLRAKFPRSEVTLVDTVCRPTKQRQEAVTDLAERCDVVVVVGGANSNNTRELAEACRRRGVRARHVQSPADLERDWFGPEDTVGLTAGTSTPDHVIDAVEEALRKIAAT